MGTYLPLVAPPSVGRQQQAGATTLEQRQSAAGATNTPHTFGPLIAAASGQQAPQAQALVSASNPLVRTVNPGDRVNIPCSLANMGGSIQFAKDDQPIILDSGCAHCQLDISNDGQASLTINRVSLRDQGHWQCWRLDANGKVKQKIPIIQLVITNSPELPILVVNDKELLGGNNLDATITVKENEIVTFKCLIKGASSPVDYVHWMLDSSQNVTHTSQLMMEYSPQENNYLTQSVLKLNATKSMNLKSISCLSNHQLWLTPMTVTAFLNVLYEPSFTISREPGFGIPVSEGMTVILKCEIDSNPSSAPVWIKDADNKTALAANSGAGQQQQPLAAATGGAQVTGKEASGEPIVLDTQDDGSVIFQPAQRTDSGWYRCKTENKYGNFSSFGYYLNVRPTTAGGGGSNSASLAAAAPSSHHQQQQQPAAQQAPSRYHQPQAPARVMAPNQPAAQVGRLGAAAASSANSHSYSSSSSSSNIMNNDQPSVAPNHNQFPLAPFNPTAAPTASANCKQPTGGNRLAIDGFPEIDHPVTTVQAVLGRPLILPLRFCCNPGPARVFWIHRHLAMIPGRMFGPYITRDIYTTYNSFYCYESTFEIESVKPEDIGTVYVFVSNEKGHAGAQIHIQLATKAGGEQVTSSLGSRFSLSSSAAARTSSPLDWSHLVLTILTPLLTSVYLYQSQFGQVTAPTATKRLRLNNR